MEGFWREIAIFNNSLETWAIAIVAANIAYFALVIFRRMFINRLTASKAPKHYDDLILKLLRATKTFVIFFVAVLIGNSFLDVPLFKGKYHDFFVVMLIAIQVGIWGEVFISYFLTRSTRDLISHKDPARATTMVAFGFVARIVLWVLLLLLILENLGINVTALLTGLGVGGVAVALALQNILGDLFASMSIVLDKPFVIGDVIQVGNDVGTVEQIGLKTTRLKSISGEQLIYSNSDLLRSQIRNHRRMEERRVAFTVHLAVDTPPEKVRRVPGLIRGSVEKERETRFERSHFLKITNSSLEVETVFHVLSPNYDLFCEVQQNINLALMETFQKEGIAFAFPPNLVHVVQGHKP